MNKTFRDLTSEDVAFLKDLQHEMNTQNTVGQASPRFWVVRDIVREYGCTEDYSHGSELYCCNGEKIEKFDDFVRNLKDVLEKSGGNYEVTFSDEDDKGVIIMKIEDIAGDEVLRYMEFSLSDLVKELVSDEVISDDTFERINYKDVPRICESTLFLTLKECKEYIDKYYYNYTENVHSYAMTAYRSSQIERLYDVLENVDFEKLVVK